MNAEYIKIVAVMIVVTITVLLGVEWIVEQISKWRGR